MQNVSSITCADHRRNAEFARNNRGMAGASAAIGDNGTRGFHHGLPVGIGDVSHQHIARQNGSHLVFVFDNAQELQLTVSADVDITLEKAVEGVKIPFHKGAAEYYSERGITVKTAG